jgi:tetratricopeptide (TPR) repeat protein
MLDCEFYGLNPTGHHWTNVELHIANTLLLFFILFKMTGALWRSALVAALFALHPLHVESVVWVAERKDVLSTFFGLLTILAYYFYVKQPNKYKYLVVILFLSLGLMAKPMLVTLPFLLLLLDFWPLARLRFETVSRLVLEKIPLFVPAIISSCLTFMAQQSSGAVVPLESFSLKARIANAFVSYASYVVKAIWPHKLTILYPHPGNSLPLWQAFGAILLVAVTSFLAIRSFKKYPYIAVGLFWYLGTLVPVIGLVQVGSQAMADRYTYIPLIGLFIIVSWGASELTLKWHYRKIFLVVSWASIFTALTACAYFQAGHWKNDIILFQHALKVTDNNWPAHYNLGVAWYERGKFDEAVLQFEQVLKIKPANAGARNNLAKILFNHGKFEEAALQLKEALKYNPHDADICNNLAVIFASQNKFDEAISLFEQAIRINSEYADAHFNLGSLLARQGKFKSAGRHCAEAIRIKPDYAEAYYQIGNILTHQGDYKKACIFFSRAVLARPDFVKAQINFEKYLKLYQPKQKVLGNNEVIDLN